MSNKVAQHAFDHLIDDLRATHGDNLSSVVLYGSAAAGDHVEFRSDYNLLIALHRITPEDLRLAQAPMREWRRLGHPLPVYFTVAELQTAGDVFPIEFHLLEKARTVLYGEDPLQTLRISDEHLRHQTEYELRSKLLQLRRHYIPASVSTEKLQELMRTSLVTFAALCAPALILRGVEPPAQKRACVETAVRHFGLDMTPFARIFELREDGANSLTDVEANEIFAAYMAQIERLIEAVDRIEVKGGVKM
ncbi:MAG TPA: hypothetical protein VM866_01405 [Pyrinomonadaceae bacterium]|jgi:predicted nucleotidyltransferase|nr:hypothetical protein [Pyrinomonadaceae bacterium]